MGKYPSLLQTRYLFLGGLDPERITRCTARLDMELQEKFQNKVVELTHKAKKMCVTTPAGTDVSFENASRPITNELRADVPGPHFLVGQIGWAPKEGSINGLIVFDGSFSGGGEAVLGILAHICCGFNPGAVLTGLCTEDERVWGVAERGNGYQGPMFEYILPEAVAHADGICLNSTVELDSEFLTKEGW
jgi:leucyl aminopeptidase (aminopeptidase T)